MAELAVAARAPTPHGAVGFNGEAMKSFQPQSETSSKCAYLDGAGAVGAIAKAEFGRASAPQLHIVPSVLMAKAVTLPAAI
jgi:hypothetical protein